MKRPSLPGESRWQAVREFTDREEPRRAFWNKYGALAEDDRDILYIIHFYGIGGIGKSTLLRELAKEMRVKSPEVRYALMDFAREQRGREPIKPYEALNRVKRDLEERYGFDFPLYEYARYVYLKKCDKDGSMPAAKNILTPNSVLRLVVETLGELPVVGVVAKIGRFISDVAEQTSSLRRLSACKRQLTQIEMDDPEKTLENLPEYFVMDLRNALDKSADKKAEKRLPFVFMIDTYEWMQEQRGGVGTAAIDEKWILNVLMSLPETLWVIAGREMLRWAEQYDSGYQAIDAHRLGDLSEKDCRTFLEKAGIGGEETVQEIVSASHGTPLYLDICVDIYEALVNQDRTPTADNFHAVRRTELVERFIRYLDETSQNMIYSLACLDWWNDSLAQAVLLEAGGRFVDVIYARVMRYSFIQTNGIGQHSMHPVVQAVLRTQCPPALRQRIMLASIRWYKNWLSTAQIDDELLVPIACAYTELVFRTEYDEDELAEALHETVICFVDRLIETARFSDAEKILEKLYAGSIPLQEDGPLCIELTILKADLQHCTGQHAEELVLRKRVLEHRNRILGDDHPDTFSAMNNLAITYYALGHYDEALALQERVLEISKRILGDDHPNTLSAMNNLASIYSAVGRIQEALALQKHVLESMQRILGDEHPTTLLVKKSMKRIQSVLES